MYNDELIDKFCKERNIKYSTRKGYISSLGHYSGFHGMSLEDLLDEARGEEDANIILKNRMIKERLLSYRSFLLNSSLSSNTIKTYFSKIKTFYLHYEVELPNLPDFKYDKPYETNYLDLPQKEDIRRALEIVTLPFKALILFMSSSGTAKAETLSLTVGDFIKATRDFHSGSSLDVILDELNEHKDIVPTIYLRRIKTDKYYYTFCSPEASTYIVKYLKTRKDLKFEDKLFPFTDSVVITKFQKINDTLNWGFKGKYRFFRTHTLRKYHASNIGLSAEYVDALQGRSKDIIHETYIKTNPEKLKEKYRKAMKNVMVLTDENEDRQIKEDIHITINIFLADTSYNIY